MKELIGETKGFSKDCITDILVLRLSLANKSKTDCQPTLKYGQHTEEVLLALGYTKEEIDNLRQLGAIN